MERLESEVIKACQSGQSEAFAELYNEYISKIYNYLYYRTHHKETAEDLASKTFFKALDNINKFNAQKGNFSAWIFRIARNNLYDHYRSLKPVANIDDIWDLGEDSGVDRDIDTKAKLAEIKNYLQKIPASSRDIIIMRVWDELSYKEIATILGKSEAACKMSFSRAISKLRQEMPLAIFISFLLSNYKNL